MDKADSQMVLKKPVQALVMIPKMGKLTLTGRKLLNVLLHATQVQIAEFALQGKEVPADHLFAARLCDLLEPIEFGSSNLRSSAKAYFLEMRDLRLEWEAPDAKAKAGVIWTNYDLLSEAQLEYSGNEPKEGAHQNQTLIAKWAFPPSIFKTLRFPDLYAQISIYQIAKMSTYESLALYEICSRYRTNPEGLTSSKPPEWWVRALSNKAPAIDPASNLPKLRPWSKFKNDKVHHAIAHINERTDIDIEMIEKKDGRTITAVQFSIKRKAKEMVEDVSIGKMKPSTAQKAAQLGLSLADVSNLLRRGQNEGVLNIAIDKLADRCNRKDLTPVESKLAYLNSVLAENNKYVQAKPASAPVTATEAAAASSLSTQAVEGAQNLTNLNFTDQRRAVLKSELLELPNDRQRELAIAGLKLLESSGFISPAIKRAFESSNWVKNGLFLSKMVEAYGIEKYGEHWAAEKTGSAEREPSGQEQLD